MNAVKLALILCLLPFFAFAELCFFEASTQEAAKIDKHLIHFYAEELVRAELFSDLDEAIRAASWEWKEDSAGKKVHYKILSRSDDTTSYGYCVYSIQGQVGFLEAIYLYEEYRGQGLGKRALQALELELIEKSISEIKLHVFAHNQQAYKLYKSFGYTTESTYHDRDRPIGHHMVKILSH